MMTNSELAHEESRAEDWGHAPAGTFETKGRAPRPAAKRSARVPVPAVHTRGANHAAEIAAEIRRQGDQIRRLETRMAPGAARRQLDEARARATAAIRAAAETRSRLARKGRGDVLLDHTIARANTTHNQLDAAERRELETRRRHMARPPIAVPAKRGRNFSANQPLALYRKATNDYLRTGQEMFGGQHLRDLARKAGMTTDNGPNGGFLVHPEHDTGPLEALLYNAVVMRQVATVRPISASSLIKPVNTRGTVASWVGERETPSETDTPDIVELEFPSCELYAKPQASAQMLEDAFLDVESWLAGEVNEAFGQAEETAFTTGTGIKQPRGFLDYTKVADASWSWGNVGYVATGTDGAFPTAGAAVNQGDRLWTLIYQLKAGYRPGAKFMMNSATVGVCRTLKDGEGRWIWSDARDSAPSMLCGYETVVNETMPAIGSGTFSIAFADFARAYIIVDRIGMNVLRDPYTAKPYVMFYTRKRVGGGVQNFEAIKLLKFATS
jgi:HK97 family phage major capsid protein